MGADFIFTLGRQPDGKMPERFEGPVDEHMRYVFEDLFGDEPENDQEIIDRINQALDFVNSDARSLGVMIIDKPGTYFIVGGMSWGDTPDGYDDIELLNAAGILQ